MQYQFLLNCIATVLICWVRILCCFGVFFGTFVVFFSFDGNGPLLIWSILGLIGCLPLIIGGVVGIFWLRKQHSGQSALLIFGIEVPLVGIIASLMLLDWSEIYASHWMLIAFGILGSISTYIGVYYTVYKSTRSSNQTNFDPIPLKVISSAVEQEKQEQEVRLDDNDDNSSTNDSSLHQSISTKVSQYLQQSTMIWSIYNYAIVKLHIIGSALLLVHHLYWSIYLILVCKNSAMLMSLVVLLMMIVIGSSIALFILNTQSLREYFGGDSASSSASVLIADNLKLSSMMKQSLVWIMIGFVILFVLTMPLVRGDIDEEALELSTCSAASTLRAPSSYSKSWTLLPKIRHSLSIRSTPKYDVPKNVRFWSSVLDTFYSDEATDINCLYEMFDINFSQEGPKRRELTKNSLVSYLVHPGSGIQVSHQDLSVSVNQQGSILKLEVHEQYKSYINRDAYIRWIVELPSDSIVTNAWLGSSNQPGTPGYKQYSARISTRQAASQVFNEQIARSCDPALIEQVGPNLYQISVYPIPGVRTTVPTQHFWIEFLIASNLQNKQQDWGMIEYGGKSWPVPKMRMENSGYDAKITTTLAQRNQQTTRTIQGKQYTTSVGSYLIGGNQRVVVGGSDTHHQQQSLNELRSCIRLEDRSLLTAFSKFQRHLPPVPHHDYYRNSSVTIDFVIDRSLSMAEHTNFGFEELNQKGIVNRFTIDTASKRSHLQPSIIFNRTEDSKYRYRTVDPHWPIGSISLPEMLSQYCQVIQQNANHQLADQLLVFTDSQPMIEQNYPRLPLWDANKCGALPQVFIWSIDGAIPSRIPPVWLDQIRASGGGFYNSLSNVMAALYQSIPLVSRSTTSSSSGDVVGFSTKLSVGSSFQVMNVESSFSWNFTVQSKDMSCEEFCTGKWPACSIDANVLSSFALVQSTLINASIPSDVAIANYLAKQSSFVSAYSSIIVLVSDSQHNQLSDIEEEQLLQQQQQQRENQLGSQSQQLGSATSQLPLSTTTLVVLLIVVIVLLFDSIGLQ